MPTYPIAYGLALLSTQVMPAFAIVVLASAAGASRKRVEQGLRMRALGATIERRPFTTHVTRTSER